MPRATWSRSIDSNSAWKLPSPKPSLPLRWMISKKIGPMLKLADIVVITKGDLLDQERKLVQSGLADHFGHVEIVSDTSIRYLIVNHAETCGG